MEIQVVFSFKMSRFHFPLDFYTKRTLNVQLIVSLFKIIDCLNNPFNLLIAAVLHRIHYVPYNSVSITAIPSVLSGLLEQTSNILS